MYDELAKRLRACPDYNDGCTKCPHEHDLGCRSTTMREAADAIEELSKQVELEHQSGFADGQIAANRKKPRWIPVTERLPKEKENVLAFGTLGVAWIDWRHDNKWCCFDGVTHWMPLPTPPKEEAT